MRFLCFGLVLGASLRACSGAGAAAAAGHFYGLTLVTNGPATFGLVELDGASGVGKVVGPAHTQEFGCSDLVAIAHNTLYYLGDTSAGTALSVEPNRRE